MTKESMPARRRLIASGATIAVSAAALAGCDLNTSGYTSTQKEQLSEIVQPTALKIAKLTLERGDGTYLSDDKKSYLSSMNIGSIKPHYSALVEYKNTGKKPTPSDVTSISLYHWIKDPSNPNQQTIEDSIEIDAQGDHINTDSYWSVEELDTLGDNDKSNDIFISDLPVVDGTGDKSDMKDVTDTTRTIIDNVNQEFIPNLFPKQK